MSSVPTYDLRNPFPWYEHMRLNRPVWEEQPGVWHVFRHEDVKRAPSTI
ncbi:hypothetical protein [Alicyclobacillus acidoterrestris]|uniref:Uncharacterized protein n=1 Tax=Alicyclobacillus acidoterrestris (strain ATCC 49025 / DSM 3922 / CIP 106132 / NCIMB 13137 / GD3B) TaxID=1356854 RepID=T0CZX1_ALIAG|nr:hypothetical protein [Alicyclobacillus acidoterrestris]EPZ43066.1 hypothetical protein N007_01615 [Alicyclobacillus acidoterrestris ATCC 49025]UNO49858.1 hypothetical protein K1I37_04940 [Alicyclobacillus acidoterrestris]